MQISILGIPFEIEEVDNIEPICRDEIIQGRVLHSEGRILLRKSLPDALKRQVLIHEWVHGALTMLGHEEMSNDEAFVQGLTIAINQTFSPTITRGED